jgi:hypothetical protein
VDEDLKVTSPAEARPSYASLLKNKSFTYLYVGQLTRSQACRSGKQVEVRKEL